MLKPSTGEDDPRYAATAEAARALAALGSADLKRLELIARARSNGLPGTEWSDLLQESIIRTLEGSRRWPLGVSLVAFLAQTMRSIASEFRERRSWEVVGDPPDGVSAEGAGSLEAAQQLRDIRRMFERDADVLNLVDGIERGETARETQARVRLGAKDYDAARKRFWRGLARLDGETR